MKLKTKKAVVKRIIIKNTFFIRKKAFKSHLLRKKSSGQLRRLSKRTRIHTSDSSKIKLMLSYI